VLLVYWVTSPVRACSRRDAAHRLDPRLHGVHFWLRFRAGYANAAVWLVGIAVTIPVLALAGFVQGGLEVIEQAAPGWVAAVTAGSTPATPPTSPPWRGIIATYGACSR